MSASPLSRHDVFVLLVAVVYVFITFQSGSGIQLKPSWSFTFEHDEPHLPPVVADLDGDGMAEVVVATPDGHVIVLSAAAALAAAASTDYHDATATWRSLPVQHTASLRSNNGLLTGRRPLALATGAVSHRGGAHNDRQQRHIVVVLTEDWTVLAFDAWLRLLWEHSLGSEGGAGRGVTIGEARETLEDPPSHESSALDAAFQREVALLVSRQPIYTGDSGLVLVGVQQQERRSGLGLHVGNARGTSGGAHARMHSSEASAPSSPGRPVSSRRGDGHFNYYALEAASGAVRWKHGQADFHDALHGDEKLTPQMDYVLDLEALGGGGEAGIDGRHKGEMPWRVFKESVLRQLPHTWRHPHDTSLSLARFSRAKRTAANHASKVRGVGSGGVTHASAAGAAALGLTSSGLSALRGSGGGTERDAATAASGSGGDGGGDGDGGGGLSNVVVAKRRHGLEVLHLYTGRPLTQIELSAFASHADVNGDGAVDHVDGLNSAETSKALEASAEDAGAGEGEGAAEADDELEEAKEEPVTEEAAAKGRRGGRRRGGRHARARKKKPKSRAHRRGHVTSSGGKPSCLGRCSSGVPVREDLWNASVCSLTPEARLSRRHLGMSLHGLAAPLLVPRVDAPAMDAAFLASDGKVTCIDSEGETRWQTSTDASWRIAAPSAVPADTAFLPSLTLYVPAASSEPLLLALGERSACMLSHATGKLLSCAKLPRKPIAPPVLGDFSADGVADVIVPATTAHLGLQAAAGAGSLMSKLLFCFLGLAIVLAVLLRYGELM